jgi:glycine cleavage system transcriptional repressor
VTAIGRDRPGIVAAISGALLELEGNIEDSRMSILGGHFAVMLIVGVPDSVAPERLEQGLARVGDELGLEATAVSPVERLEGAETTASHVLTVYGADHPGIVHAVTSALAERSVNVTDLRTHVTGSPDSPAYVMLMELDLGEAAEDDVQAAISEAAEREGLEVSLRRLGAEAL